MKKIKTWELLKDNKILINDKVTRNIKTAINEIKYIMYNKKEYSMQELNDIQYFNEYHQQHERA